VATATKPNGNGKPPQEVLDWLADAGLAGEINRPVDTLAEALPRLRRPFTPAAVKFKVQATWPGGALVVSYIDARLVMDRLDMVVGENWEPAYEPTNSGLMWCHLTVCGITRRDVGEGTGKGLVSDSLKRAGVLFGIGRSLYAVPKLRVYENDRGGQPTDFLEVDSRDKYRLSPKGEHRARSDYEAWLKAVGEEAFGEPLDHGDAEDSQGDAEIEGGGREQPAGQSAEAQAVRQEQDKAAEQSQAPPEGKQAEPAAGPEEQLAELLAKKSSLKAKRAEANEGMEKLGAGPKQRFQELDSAKTGKDLDALIGRINNAMDGGGE
jgi:hypothetical protein